MDQRVKCWNQLLATPAPYQVESLEIIESNFFAPQTIKLDRIVAFIGLHGTGKSLLLRVLEASFGYTTPVYSPPYLPGEALDDLRESLDLPAEKIPPGVRRFVANLPPKELPLIGIVEIVLKTPSGRISRRVDLSQSAKSRAEIWKSIFEESFMAWYTDPVGALWENDYMSGGAKLTPSGPERKLSVTDLNVLNNILGRRYDSVTIQSVAVELSGYMATIYAKLGSQVLSNLKMSQGELWVHHIKWFLEFDKNKGHLALIDEPESFLAAQGQRAFIDQIARSALRGDRQVVIGTHSPEMLSRFPLANIRICIPSDSGVQMITPRSLIQVHESVGIQTPIRGIALVEDELAKQLLTAIFAQYDTALTREVEIIPAGGASEVIGGSQILEKADRLVCFAVLDGDQRSRKSGKRNSPATSSIYFLPGADSPESQLIASALDDINRFSDMVGIHPDQTFAAISSGRYLDHQYRIGKIAEQLGYREETLTQFLVRVWLRRRDVAQDAEGLARMIRNGLSRPSP